MREGGKELGKQLWHFTLPSGNGNGDLDLPWPQPPHNAMAQKDNRPQLWQPMTCMSGAKVKRNPTSRLLVAVRWDMPLPKYKKDQTSHPPAPQGCSNSETLTGDEGHFLTMYHAHAAGMN